MNLNVLRPKDHAFSDFLRYLLRDGDGIIRLKNNGYLSCIAFRGPSVVGSSISDLKHFAEKMESQLTLDAQWVAHIDVQRSRGAEYPSRGSWPSAGVYVLDRARGARYEADGEHFPSEHRLWLAYYPKSKPNALWNELLGRGSEVALDPRQTFLAKRNTILAQLGFAGKDVRLVDAEVVRLASGEEVIHDELVSTLYSAIANKEHRFMGDPGVPIDLSTILAPSDVHLQPDLFLADQYVATLAVTGYPHLVYAAICSAQTQLHFPYRFSTRIIPYSLPEAEASLTKLAQGHALASLGPGLILGQGANGEGDENEQTLRTSTIRAQTDAKTGVPYAAHNSTITIYADQKDTLQQRIEAVASLFSDGMEVIVENGVNRFFAFLSALPGEVDSQEFRNNVIPLGAATRVAPCTSVWHGPKKHPHPRFAKNPDPILMLTTPNGEPFSLYLHVGEVGHALIIGKTGSGKSLFLRALETGHLARYENSRVITLDVGYSAYKLPFIIRGTHLTAELHAGPQFAVLAGLHDPELYDEILQWEVETLEVWLTRPLSPQQYDDLDKANRVLADPAKHAPGTYSFSDLARIVGDSELRLTLDKFRGSFLDARVDRLDFDTAPVPYWAIEYGQLGIDNARWTVPFITFIQRRSFAAFASKTPRPTLIVVDEGARALKIPKMEEFSERIQRETRRNLGQFIFASQSTTEVMESPIRNVLIQQTATKIVFADRHAQEPTIAKEYEALGFNAEDRAIIATMNEYTMLIKNENGTQVADLRPLAFEIVAFGGASAEDKDLIDRCRAQYGGAWFQHYCDALGVDGLEFYANAIAKLENQAREEQAFTKEEVAV